MNVKFCLYCAGFFLSTVLCSQEADLSVNRKWDPGFEQGKKWWKDVSGKDFRQGVTISRGQGVNGSGALVIENPKEKWSGVFAKTLWIVQPGGRYILRFKYKAEIKNGDFKARIRFWKNTVQKGMWAEGKERLKQAVTTTRIKQSTSGNEWKNYEYTFNVPSGANGIHLELSAGYLKGKIVVDDVEIIPCSAAKVEKKVSAVPKKDFRLNKKWNPEFEEGAKWWKDVSAPNGKFSPGVRFDPSAGENNSGGFVLDNPKNNWSGIFARTIYMVEPGQSYLLEVRYKSAMTGGRAGVVLRFWSGCVQKGLWAEGKKRLDVILRSPKITKSTNGNWVTLRFPFTVPKEANGVHLEISGSGLRGSIVFDDVKLTLDRGDFAIPYLDKAPEFQGKPNPEFQKKAVKLSDFVSFPSGAIAKEKTEVYLAMTGSTLFGTALLYHPGRDVNTPLKKKYDDRSVFRNESIEFFITQTGRTNNPYYHFVFDTAGNILDGQEMSSAWNSKCKAWGGKVSKDCSLIQFMIPLKDIGYDENSERGLVKLLWKINISRNHSSGKRVYSTWTPLRTSFHEISRFRMFYGEGKNYGQVLSGIALPDGTGDDGDSADDIYWKTSKRLYKELFTNETPFQGKNSVTVWHHPTHPKNISNALQYGYQYSIDEILEEYKKYNIHPDIRLSGTPQEVLDWCKKTGIGAMVYFGYYNHDYKAVYDPGIRKKIVDELDEFLKKHDGMIMGVRLGDEVLSHYDRSLIRKSHNPAYKNDIVFQKTLERIKRDYGYGKFSIPSSEKSDDEPFQWLAVRKYCIDVMIELQKELFRLSRKHRQPDGQPLVCKSFGGTEWMHLTQPSRFAAYVDVMNVQSNPQFPQRPAFMAKYMKDLTGKPVWGICHTENTYGSFGTEKTAAIFSQLARGGATGLEHWPADWRGHTAMRGGTVFCRYGHRPRWETTLEISKAIQTMPLLKFPKEDFAFFLSNDTALSKRWNHLNEEENLFSLLGPAAGTWFRFISDTQIQYGTAKLTDWNIIVIAKAHILDPKLAEKFQEFLRKGGTLICLDPEIFRYAPDAANTSHLAKEIFGTEKVSIENSANLKLKLSDHPVWNGMKKTITPPILGSAKYKLIPADNTSVLATFSDGSAAVTMKTYPGGGKAILSAVPPIRAYADNSEWISLVKHVARKNNCAVDNDIWNFNFPYTPEKKPVFSQICLTGNHFYWWRNKPVKEANSESQRGTYSVTLLPDHLIKTKHNGVFPFGKGNLTNRLSALTAGDIAHDGNRKLVKSGQLRMDMFADTWSDPAAFDTKFRFDKNVCPTELVLFWQGELPDFTIKFPNGKEIRCKGETTTQVLKRSIPLPGTRINELTVSFDKRKNGNKLTLSEVEIWERK